MVNTRLFQLAKVVWQDKDVLGLIKDYASFTPWTQNLIDAVVNAKADYERLLHDPNYQEMRELLLRQKQAAEDLIASGNLQNPEWVRENIRVLNRDEVVRNEVYTWLNNYVQTPEGQKNLAYALVNEAGGADNQMEIEIGRKGKLNGAGGWANWYDSHVQLGPDSLNREHILPHEIRHVGQQDIPNLSQREWFLYAAGIIEADARLTEFSDGVTEGRNPQHFGYRGLEQDFQAALKELKETRVKSWEDFEKLKDTNRARYNQIMGRMKEREFCEVLNHLMKTPIYQTQGSAAKKIEGTGNLNGLRAWCEQMCDRQGMRFSAVWPEVEAMATGKKEIPGMEGAFDQEGKLTDKGLKIFKYARAAGSLADEVVYNEKGKVIQSQQICIDGSCYESIYDDNGKLVKEVSKSSDGKSCERTYDPQTRCVVWKDAKGAEFRREESTLDRRGRTKSSIVMYPDGVSFETVYDGNGNIAMEFDRGSDGKICRSYEYSYDWRGNKTRDITKDGNGNVILSYEYSYSWLGRRKNRIQKFSDGSSIELFYDKDENITSQVDKDAQGQVVGRYEYSYDANGNRVTTVKEDRFKITQAAVPGKGAATDLKKLEEVAGKDAEAEQVPQKDEKEKPLNAEQPLSTEQPNQQMTQKRPKRRADKTEEKQYYGNYLGGVDDRIAQMDQESRARMASERGLKTKAV